MATSKSMNRVFLLSLIHYFGVLFSVLRSLWSDKPLCVILKEKYRSSGELFCSEAKFSDEKVLARLAGLARQSRLHGKFSARLAEIPALRCRDPI